MRTPALPWWHPDELARRRPFLEARTRVMAAVRQFFAARDFVEVETPILQISPGMEVHLQPFATPLNAPFEATAAPRYLHTSPEFAMKKLLAGGVPRLYQVARVFRNGERSDTHHPEFTMLEWYRAGATWEDLADDLEALLPACGETRPILRLPMAEAFERFCGIDLLATIASPEDPEPPAAALLAEAQRLNVRCDPAARWEDVFFALMLNRIEPELERLGPVILSHWPACTAALSRRTPGDPRTCDRFELYVNGLELANAFGELTDAAEQRRRFQQDMDLRHRLYGSRLPVDEDFLAALEHGLPDPCAGIALGLDRLVMVVSGAKRIDQVLWAPVA